MLDWASDPGPVTDRDAIVDRQRARESAARTYARWLDIVPARARGAEIIGADGRTYLDCLAGAGTLALGHDHPEVTAAVRRTLDSGAPLHALDVATPQKDAFVTELLDGLPAALRAHDLRIQFCSPAGTDAVEAALKLARVATGRRGLVAFTGAYHGMSAGSLAVSGGVAARTAAGVTGADVTRLPYPYPYRCPFGLGGHQGATVAVHHARRLLGDPKGGVVPPAAIVVEPVQGEGGVVPAPDDWLREMRRLADDHGALLVLDEVQTGVGRTGAMWAQEHAGVVPDVLVVSKAIGGGLPLAAIVYRAELDRWAPGAHAGTFRGNVLAMVAGAETLRIVRRDDLPRRAAQLGTRMLDGLRDAVGDHPAVGEVRGRGLMLGVEVVDPTGDPDHLGSLPASTDRAHRVRRECLDRGLIVELGGRDDAVVRLLPPLVLSDAQADRAVAILADAITAADAAVRSSPRPLPTDAALAADRSTLDGLVDVVGDALERGRAERGGPTPAGDPAGPARRLDALVGERIPARGVGARRALDDLVGRLAADHADPADPHCAAHLHAPPLAVAVAADLAVSVLNPSLDSWDQGPSSAAVEDRLLAWLADLAGLDPARAGGTVTTGATASTLTALLLAREAAGPDRPLRIVCSDHAHFSIQRAAQVLGLDAAQVVAVPGDASGRLDPGAVDAALRGTGPVPSDGPAGRAVTAGDRAATVNLEGATVSLEGAAGDARDGVDPRPTSAGCIVATAGTTDLAAIDPLPALADVAAAHGAWLHVDAAYGGLALLSDRLAPLVDGLDRADSIALDAHKLGWQPVAAGVLLVADADRMAPLHRQVDYLNAPDDDAAGYADRLGRSLRTTRRPDAFKLLVTLHALGRDGLGDLVDRCHDLARAAADAVAADRDLDLHGPPTLTTVLLRPRDDDPVRRDATCATVRRTLMRDGRAVIGRTDLPGAGPGRRWLKLTLLNPHATDADVRALVRMVGDAVRDATGEAPGEAAR